MKYFPQKHTGEHINIEITSMIKFLGLDDKRIFKVVATDTASNALKSIKLSEDLVSQKCVNHKLNLCITDILESSELQDNGPNSVKHVVDMACHLAAKCKNTPNKHRAVVSACRAVGIEFTTFKLRVKTRWNSVITCCRSVLKLKLALLHLRNEDPDVWAEFAPDEVQFKVLESVCKVLEEPLRATKIWEADKNETIHLVTQELFNMTENLECLCNSSVESRSVKEFAGMLLARLKVRFPNCGTDDVLQAVANYLHPDLRGLHLEDYQGLKEKTKADIKEMFQKDDSSPDIEALLSEDNLDDTVDLSALNPTERKKRIRAMQTSRPGTSSVTEEKGLDYEFKVFESLPEKGPETDVMLWWKEASTRLPLMFDIVRIVFSVLASSCTSERIFSICGQMATKKRVRLNEKKLEELTVINRNYRKVQRMLHKLAPKIKEKRIEAKGKGKALEDSIQAIVENRSNVVDEYGIEISSDEVEILFDEYEVHGGTDIDE